MDMVKIPRRGYVKTSTPIEYCPNFSKALGADIDVYIKRDDILPGAGGGNKTRKLDFFFADAVQKGCDTIVTCGAVQSNHCRLALSWAAHEGMDCHLLLEEHVKGSYSPEASGNIFLVQLLGVKSITVLPGGSNMMEAMQQMAAKLTAEGKKPYIIPSGASSPLGALGYVGCMEEIKQQMLEMQLTFDHIVLPSGTGGTHAGITAAMTNNSINIPVTGIGINRPKPVQEKVVHTLANQTLDLMGITARVPAEKVVVFDDYVGSGYSRPTEAMVEAVKMLAKTEAILLDPVYTGKAMSGLIDLAHKGYFAKNSKVLFLHTGGAPVLYAYLSCFR